MAEINEIRGHLKSIQDTSKLTNAMYLVSSAGFKKARQLLFGEKQYYDIVSKLLSDIYRPDVKSVYSKKGQGYTATFVFTSDRGLCGDYNKNAVEFALKERENRTFFLVGNKSREIFMSGNIDFCEDFVFSIHQPDDKTAEILAGKMNDLWLGGEYASVEAVYTDTVNGLRPAVRRRQILPLCQENVSGNDVECLGSRQDLFDIAAKLYIKAAAMDIIANAYAAEQFMRMFAMDTASKNARELEDELQKQYYHSRQSQITNEIIEISNSNR